MKAFVSEPDVSHGKPEKLREPRTAKEDRRRFTTFKARGDVELPVQHVE